MTTGNPRFVHLHVHSEYSLLDGCARIPALIDYAAQQGFHALAVTDHGATCGLVPFYRRATAAGIQPILGAELYVRGAGKHPYHLPVLAENAEGYRNLLRLVSLAHLDGFHTKPTVDVEALSTHSRGLIAFSGCLKGETPQLLMQGRDDEALRALIRYREIFGPGSFFVELQRHGLDEEEQVNSRLVPMAQRAGLRSVATNDVHYLDAADWRVHDVLLAVQTLSTVAQANRLRLRSPQYYLKSGEEMERLFADQPDALQATLDIAQRCRVDLDLGRLHIPHFPAPEGRSQHDYLAGLCRESAHRKFGPHIPREVDERLEYELGIIGKMGFSGYFLIVWDIVAFAKREGIPVGPGRGSGVGSIVSFLLDISTVNPLDHGLVFERFLNPERVSMPDIDIDLCHVGRPKVLEYVRRRWGREHVAHLGAFTTLRPRAAVRDVGRALGANQDTIDRIARLIPAYSSDLRNVLRESDRLRALVESETQARQIVDLAVRIQGLPRHMTQHAAGIVLADGPLTNYVALQRAGGDEIITQADMHAVEDLGLLKIDLLGLRYLTVMDETIRSIAREEGSPGFSAADIPVDDPTVYQAMARGETIGTFQLESSGMRRLLRRLKPERLDDVMCVCALFRPGPLASGMVEAFIRRRHGDESVSYFHPVLEPILRDTYGVILYQEQVMQVAQALAGYSLGRADMLRKAIAKCDPAALDRERETFLEGARKRGIPGGVAGKVFALIREFGGYGYAKAHAAAYARTAVHTVWLKLHHPVPYFAAMLSQNCGWDERFDQYLSEVRYLGIPIVPPDINRSGPLFTAEGPHIRAGLALVRDVGERAVQAILSERARGCFVSLGDFCRRLGGTLSRKAVDHLIRVGAFDPFGGTRPGMLLALQGLWETGRRAGSRGFPGQLGLLGGGEPAGAGIGYCPPEFPERERQEMEHDLLGFYLTSHPLDPHVPLLRRLGVMPAAEVAECDHGAEVFLGGCPGAARGHRTRDGKRMLFATLEDLGGRADLVVFPTALQKYGPLLADRIPILVWGQVDRTEDEPTVIVRKVAALGGQVTHPGAVTQKDPVGYLKNN